MGWERCKKISVRRLKQGSMGTDWCLLEGISKAAISRSISVLAVSMALSGQNGKRGSRDGMGVRFACYPYGSGKGIYDVP